MISNKYRLILIGVFVGIIGIGASSYFFIQCKDEGGCGPDILSSSPITLEVWGVFDNQGAYSQLFAEFQSINPNVNFIYRKLNIDTYEQELLSSFATQRGPDIFQIHSSRIDQNQIHLAPVVNLTQSLFGIDNRTLMNNYVNVVGQDMLRGQNLYAIPFSVDTLALFYNDTIFFNNILSSPPQTWTDFLAYVEQLAEVNLENASVVRPAAAIGTARNINRSTDILMALMFQSGVQIFDQDFQRVVIDQSPAAITSLRFYTDFANPRKKVYTWNTAQDFSTDDFANGDVAMIFNYSYLRPTLARINPALRYSIAPLPQISNTDTPVSYANYWSYGVAATSNQQAKAWEFLLFAQQKERVKSYLSATGRPPARTDLAQELAVNPDHPNHVFAKQALFARTWFQRNPDKNEQILANMIEEVVIGSHSVEEALTKAANELTRAMR